MPKAYQNWQQEAAELLSHIEVEHLFEGPVRVELEFLVTRPRTSKLLFPKPDIDNYAKSILDSITKDGRFWNDDTQVVILNATKEWATEQTGIRVLIEDL